MPLAPPFTKENAAENARKATISREDNRMARIVASLPERAQGRAVTQVNKVLRWMEKEKDRTEFAKLTNILDKLWNKAYPTAGVLRPGKRSRPEQPTIVPATPQELEPKPVQKPNDSPGIAQTPVLTNSNTL